MDSVYGRVNFSESDSAGALEELDRGLRSGKIGEQCGAIAKLPFLLERYPFPLFINSSVLKIAEVFKEGGNLLRSFIVKVAERSEKHLHRITSVDEVLKRIFSVSHSNDPEARSLTLRLLGYLASIFAEKKSVHHLLSNSFESRDYEELQAAIEASQLYAKYSRDFAHEILEKVEQVLLSLETTAQTKLRLIPIFRYMFSQAGDVKRVLKLCNGNLLYDCPDPRLRILTLNVLTELAIKSQLIVPDQILILLDNLSPDASSRIHSVSVRNLKKLADTSPHMWTLESVKRIIEFCLHNEQAPAQIRCLQILVSLTKTRTCTIWLREYGLQLQTVCVPLAINPSPSLSLSAIKVLSNISDVNGCKGSEAAYSDRSLEIDCLLALIYRVNAETTDLSFLKETLKLVQEVIVKDPAQGNCLVRAMLALNDSQGSGFGGKEIWLSLVSLAEKMPEFYPDLTKWAYQKAESTPGEICIELANLLLPPRLVVEDEKLIDSNVIERLGNSSEVWKVFQLGRKAMRNGWPIVALNCFRNVRKQVVKSVSDHYLRALINLSEADLKIQKINSELIAGGLDEAHALYLKAGQQFQLAGSLNQNKSVCQFHKEWLQCRLAFIEASRELTVIINCLKLFPPPASALLNDAPKGQMSKILSQLSKCAIQFRKVGNRYSDFLKRCFDCDYQTLETIRLLQLTAVVMEKSIGKLLGSSSLDVCLPEITSLNCCNKLFSACLLRNIDRLKNWNLDAAITPDTAKRGMAHLLDTLIDLVQIPMYYPRCFFQVQQKTEIQLKVHPQPQGTSKSLNVVYGQELIISVEGLAQRSSNRKPIRTVSEVTLHVSLEMTATREVSTFEKDAKRGTDVLRKSVPPQNDYFSGRFLISFPPDFQSGFVLVTAEIIDVESEQVWESGSFQKLRVNMIGTDPRPSEGGKRKLDS